MKPLIPLLSFVLLFSACGSDADKPVADESKRDMVDYKSVIDETNKSFTAAALNGDSASFVTTLYHP